MPATLAPSVRTLTRSRDVLDAALEETLITGRGPFGETHRVRTLDEWRAAWGRWRDVVLPKVERYLPGRRPFACYATHEIPPRPLLRKPPADAPWFRLYVPDEQHGGTWHYDYPQPYQRPERWYLVDLGIVTLDELKRYRPMSRLQFRKTYVWEAGGPCGGSGSAEQEPHGEG